MSNATDKTRSDAIYERFINIMPSTIYNKQMLLQVVANSDADIICVLKDLINQIENGETNARTSDRSIPAESDFEIFDNHNNGFQNWKDLAKEILS